MQSHTNIVSQRMMQKVGFVFEREIMHLGESILLSRMTRSEYLRGREA